MTIHCRKSGLLVLTVFAALLVALPSPAATYQKSYNFGSNLGYLTYEEMITTSGPKPCGEYYYVQTTYAYLDFVYFTSQGASQAIPGATSYIPGVSGCSSTQIGPTVNYAGTGYAISINPGIGSITATINVPGYLNPKFVVLGVIYAPPGPSSNVDYTNSELLSSTTSTSSSFSSGYTLSVKVKSGAITGWANGSVTGTSSTSFTQESTSSSSVTASKQSGVTIKVPGPASPYVGVNHDYDVILVWLNPVVLLTLANYDQVQWNGFGYSTLDQPAMDVVGVYVGCLNGDISQTWCNSQYQTVFGRAWASGETWPSGQGPGLTTTDLQNIMQTDPYWQCNSTSPIGSSACPSPDPTRFTLTYNENLLYQQAPPNGEPLTNSYTETYTNTTTQSQGGSDTFSQTFGMEEEFGATPFGIGVTVTLSESNTLTWKYQWNNQITSTTSSTAAASLTGPPCNTVNNTCSPVYPPSSPTYGQAMEFDVYQDSLYGTFLLVPTDY
jgi:hypothetical protein